jgi:Flp pilus assembly protein CpaB
VTDNTENEKSKLGLVLAIVAGLLAMGMVFVFLQKVKKDAAGGKGPTRSAAGKTKSVLVAVRDLPSGHTLSVNSDLKEMEIPVGKSTMEFTRQCVPSNRAAELEGRTLGVGIAAQFPLLYSNLVGSTRIDDDFKEGFLKSIEISKVNLIGNQLIPGDRVVVLATVPKKDEEKGGAVSQPALSPSDPSAMTAAILKSMPSMNPMDMKVETITVLENAEVFLVGSMRKIDRLQMGYFPAERDTASEITFRLNMVDALKLTQYENTPGAKLTLLLRPRNSEK